MVESFVQGQNLNNLQWLCLQECMIQKLPSNLFNCCHLQIFHLTKCNCPQMFFDFLSHNHNMSICVYMNELPTFIGKLNELLELNLSRFLNLQILPTSIGQLNALQNLHFDDSLKFQKSLTSIDRLSALQNLHLNDCSNL
jgi:Leucine-rich repeat (LRR) protein